MTSTNQTAIVTGAGQGAGRVIARKLASRGINILVADVNETTSQKVVQELKDDFGVDAVFVKTDISIEEDVRNMVQTVVDRWGRLDWACNNACVVEAMARDEDNVTTEQFDRMYAVNQRGNWLCQKYECIQMRSQEPRPVTLSPSSRTVMQRGAVVTISSVNGNTGAGLPGYSAAKAAILSLARTGAQFYGPYDVRVNVVSPGPIAHDGFSRWLETQSPEIVKFIEGTTSSTPLRRQAYPEEVADTVNWLLSDGSTFITGANIICDGGLLAARF